MGLRLMCAGGAALAALLLLLTAAILRLVVLLVQLVTPRYTLAACASALALWLVDARRQRYAKGFYSCSRLPQAQLAEQQQETPLESQTAQQEHEQSQGKEAEEEKAAATAAVAPVTPETLPMQLKQMTAAPPSETESEDDDSEAGAAPSASSPTSRHSKSLADVRTRSNTTDGELQRRQATRPRSSSAVGESRSTLSPAKLPVSRSSHADVLERKRRLSRRRADTGMNGVAKQQERARRATYTSKQDAYARRSSSERLEDAMRSDGYWIGDFRVQRRLVSRRSHATSSPNAN